MYVEIRDFTTMFFCNTLGLIFNPVGINAAQRSVRDSVIAAWV
jgi:hypothetical protein